MTQRVNKKLNQSHLSLIKNTQWLLLSEGTARVSRLVTIIALANYLNIVNYGTAMLAITCYELIRVSTRLGSGALIIQCEDSKLLSYCSNALTLNWLIYCFLATLQFCIAPYIATFYSQSELTVILRIMAISYLIYPIVTIKVYLIQRNNQMKFFSLCSAAAITADNLSTALLAVMGFGIYSVAIAKIIAAIVWVLFFITADTPKIKPAFSFSVIKTLLSFSTKVLSSELLKTSRTQLDVLLAGKLLSPDLFGLYSFAKSAGVGLGQSLSNAYLTCIYPRLSELQRQNTIASGLPIILGLSLIICIAFVAQSLLAPYYIPLLFSQNWINASQLVSLLCLSAIPSLFIDIFALILRVKKEINKEVYLQLTLISMLFFSLSIVKPTTAIALAETTVLVSFSWLLVIPLFYINSIKLFYLRGENYVK